jgi:saccharopine dehydrogenase-like NADP-dependent oxidoreductase
MVGSAIGHDLAQRHTVCITDMDSDRLRAVAAGGLKTASLDVRDHEALRNLVARHDLVIGAVPGFLGFKTLEAILPSGKPVVDISFFAEDALALDDVARRHECIAVVDAGVAPGLDNLILGHHDRSMKVERFECLVGGLPKLRKWPFEYKAPFSPIDVIEEYTRPARFVEGGVTVTRPALSDPEIVHFDQVGSLEAFNTDGLRTLIDTMSHIPDMKERTLRYPGHIDLIRALRDSGFFADAPVEIDGITMSPLKFTSRILMDNWQLEPNEPEYTVMRVTVEGRSGDVRQRFVYELYDEYDATTNTSSMARTTGYTCAAIAQLILDGHYSRVGVSPPEFIGREVGCFGRIVGYLAERNVMLKVSASTPEN